MLHFKALVRLPLYFSCISLSMLHGNRNINKLWLILTVQETRIHDSAFIYFKKPRFENYLQLRANTNSHPNLPYIFLNFYYKLGNNSNNTVSMKYVKGHCLKKKQSIETMTVYHLFNTS